MGITGRGEVGDGYLWWVKGEFFILFQNMLTGYWVFDLGYNKAKWIRVVGGMEQA